MKIYVVNWEYNRYNPMGDRPVLTLGQRRFVTKEKAEAFKLDLQKAESMLQLGTAIQISLSEEEVEE